MRYGTSVTLGTRGASITLLMTRRMAILLGLAAPTWAAAKEFWNEKPPEQWSPDEVQALLTKSPWAREAAISYYGGQNGPLSPSVPNQNRRRANNDGTAPSTQSPAEWKAYVRWQSALPVRQAMQIDPSDELEKYYILNMLGDVPSVGTDADGFKALQQVTTLEHKGDAIHLAKVAVSPRNNFTLAGTLFYFSRDLALRLEDKQATFVTKLGPIDLKCKFTLREMMYRGKLEL